MTRNNGHARRGGGRIAFPANRSANGAGQKLTADQRVQVLDWLGRGWPPSKVRDALREAGGPTLALPTVVGYLKRHAEEVAMKRAAWLAKLRDEPLATPRDRVRELTRMYGTGVLAQFRELCPTCGGDGTLPILRRPKDEQGHAVRGADPVKGTICCETCRGRKWILPAAVQRVVETTRGDIRLDTLPERPPAVDPEGLEALRSILCQIREEVGDAWSPREQSTKPDGNHVSGDVNMNVVGGDKQSYIAKLRAMRGAPPLPPLTVEVSPTPGHGNGNPPSSTTAT